MRLKSLLLVIVLGAWLAGCGVAGEPLAFGTVPWQDGESSEYHVLGPDGAQVGVASWTWEAMPGGWRQRWMVELATRTDLGVVEMGADLYPLQSELAMPASYHTASYGSDQIEIVIAPAEGQPGTRTLRRPEHPIDNGQSLQVHRALPLATGYATRYTNVVPTTGAAAHTLVRVEGVETIGVPAGTFQTWHLIMTTGGASHDAWYAIDPPHHMVRYRNRAAGTQFVLARWQPTADAPWETGPGPADPTQAEPGASDTGPDWLRVGFAFGIQYPLMILLPLVLGWWIRRRYGVGWRVFAMGAATFVLSQVVHLPINYALGLLGPGGRGVSLWPLAGVAVVAGVTSGISEEVARWLVLRSWLRDTRGWAGALQFGAGHGGIEAILLGALALMGMFSALAASLAGQGIPALAVYWQIPWYEFVLAGLERVFAITVHIALAMLVMRSVMTRRLVWLVAAIALHAVMNFWAVWGMQQVGVLGVVAGLALLALGALALIIAWRRNGVLDYQS